MQRPAVASDDINDDERNIILLARRGGLPLAEFREQLTRQFRGGLQAILAYHAFQLPVAKGLTGGIL